MCSHQCLTQKPETELVYLPIALIVQPPDVHIQQYGPICASLPVPINFKIFTPAEGVILLVIVGNGCLRPSPDKIEAVRNWPLPETQRHVKSFVAFCSFYRKFVQHFADCSAPLIDMTRKGKPGKVVWDHQTTTRGLLLRS